MGYGFPIAAVSFMINEPALILSAPELRMEE
jgi:hypothetical protein